MRPFLCSLPLLALIPLLVLAEDQPNTGPWDLKALAQPPKVTVLKEEPGLVTLTYTNVPYLGKPTQVFAYLAIPKEGTGPFPAMVLVHGGGGTAFREWAELWAKRGYVALAMDLAGSTPEKKRLPDGGPGQDDNTKFNFEKVEDAWTYHAVAAVIHGVSLLSARKDVDPQRIGITGISWGGYLTCIVAGLDQRLKVAVPVYGCGYLAANSVWKKSYFDKWSPEKSEAWLKHFGPERYVGQAKMPVLFVNGTNDFAYPLDSYQKTYEPVKNRTLCVTKEMPHSHRDGWAPVEIGAFVDQYLKKGPALANVDRVQRTGNKVSVTFAPGGSPIKSAQLITTTDESEWQKRKWTAQDVKVVGNTVQAELPEKRPLVWFVTITDERKVTVSTAHEEVK
jgi:dienelactone hydrolase